MGLAREEARALGANQGPAAMLQKLDPVHGAPGERLEKDLRIELTVDHGFGHAVVHQARRAVEQFGIDLARLEPAAFRNQEVLDSALHSPHSKEATVVCDVSGLAGPRGNRPEPGYDNQFVGILGAGVRNKRCAVVEQINQVLLRRLIRCFVAAHKMHITRLYRFKGQAQRPELSEQTLLFEGGKDGRTREVQDREHSVDQAAARENTHFTATGAITRQALCTTLL